MNTQMSFATFEHGRVQRVTRRQKFLQQMEKIVPWEKLEGLIQKVYPKGGRGRPPIGIGKMLRIYFLSQWYNLADEAVEDQLSESLTLSKFAGIDLGRERVPDATTLLQFRHLLEKHDLCSKILEEINNHLREQGKFMSRGTIVDATIIEAPSSTKNKAHERDPEMHQTKKGNQWHFGCKAHIGVDADSGLVHTLVATAANEADINQSGALLKGGEQEVVADSGYTGMDQREEVLAKVDPGVILVAPKPSQVNNKSKSVQKLYNTFGKKLASVRSKVEHVFQIIKCRFRFRKVRYRGLYKNTCKLHVLMGLANLLLAQRKLA